MNAGVQLLPHTQPLLCCNKFHMHAMFYCKEHNSGCNNYLQLELVRWVKAVVATVR